MRVAVVIPVKNEEIGLGELLDRLCAQLRPGDSICITDAGSTDRTLEILRARSAADTSIHVFEAPGALPGRGRNIAISNAEADIIAQIDGGNLLNDCWLDELRKPIEAGAADYVTGNLWPMPIPKRFFGAEIDMGEIYAATLFRGPICPEEKDPEGIGRTRQGAAGGQGCAYRREIWERAGGFPEWLRYGEDPAFIQKLAQQDIRYAFAVNSVILWQLGPGLGKALKRHFEQRVSLYRRPASRRRMLPKTALYLAYAVTIAFSLFSTVGLAAAFVLTALLSGHQTYKSYKAYWQSPRRTPAQDLAALFIFPAIHVPILFVWLWGTLYGLVVFSRGQPKRDYNERLEQYLRT